MPDFRSNWTFRNYRKWVKHIHPLFKSVPNLKYLEIGVFEGRSAIWFMDKVLTGEGCHAYLLDAWVDPSRKESQKKYGLGKNIESRARMNLAPYSDRCTIYKGESLTTLDLPEIQALELDLVYVDGAHHDDLPLKDAQKTWELMKVGGVQIWDDVYQKDVKSSLAKFEEMELGELIYKGRQSAAYRKVK